MCLGYELMADGKTCIFSESFLLFSRFEHIGILSFANSHFTDIVPIAGLKEARYFEDNLIEYILTLIICNLLFCKQCDIF